MKHLSEERTRAIKDYLGVEEPVEGVNAEGKGLVESFMEKRNRLESARGARVESASTQPDPEPASKHESTSRSGPAFTSDPTSSDSKPASTESRLVQSSMSGVSGTLGPSCPVGLTGELGVSSGAFEGEFGCAPQNEREAAVLAATSKMELVKERSTRPPYAVTWVCRGGGQAVVDAEVKRRGLK